MKKFYSLVLMAAALLIGTNAWAMTRTAGNDAQLQAAWAAAQNEDVIQLTSDITLTKTLWLGTATMNDANAKSITLDLNGYVLNFQDANAYKKMFFISHGELNVITSRAGGKINHQGTSSSSNFEIFRITGSTYKDVNPKTATSGYYSHLTIGEGVQLIAKANAIVVDEMSWGTWSSSVAWPKYGDVISCGVNNTGNNWPTALNTRVYHLSKDAQTSGNRGTANGARVDVYGIIHANKYAIKANGNMGSPSCHALASYTTPIHFYANQAQTVDYSIDPADVDYSPFIHIHSTAELLTLQPTLTSAIAAYSGGYARWLVEGSCIGSTGVYVKSGELVLNDAVIASNYTGTYVPAAHDQKSGVDAAGSGIVMESSSNYAGDIDVTVQGDTRVSATSGYAIDEAITADSGNGDTKVDAITISGGTFESGDEGTIKVTETTVAAAVDPNKETSIAIVGGNAEGQETDVNIGGQTLLQFLQTQQGDNAAYATVIDDGNGGQTIVINQGTAPSSVTEWSNIIAAGDSANANWTGLTPAIVGDGVKDTVVILGELLMNAGNKDGEGVEHLQQLTIKKNATLEVKNLVMNAYARITVEPGAKFVVYGDQGIVAPNVENIVLQNEGALVAAQRNHATFLFNPAVSSNRHPNATVELTTYSFRNSSSDYQWERFGVPTHNAVKFITTESSVPTAFAAFIDGDWQNLGYLNYGTAIDPADFNKPFATYELMANRSYDKDAPTIGPKYQFKGELMGNDNAALNVDLYWTPFTNSYAANIDVYSLLTKVSASSVANPFVYIARPTGLGSYSWDALDADEVGDEKLAPMQAFMLQKAFGSVQTDAIELNYNSMVWNPATKNAAPRRRVAADNFSARFRVVVENEQGAWDNVKLRETVTRLAEAEKYMNADVNIYAMSDMKDAILATENLENTFVGFSTVKGGNFTISFANVSGRELVLVDHETGARVAIAEGNTYEFTAAANSVNDYRFEIVEPAKLPTAIENTEAVKSAKGIYTITGQFVGEMNVWNTLPAGIYVVNGEKRVK